MLALPQQKRRRPSLTPLIDVVFLLLIFFMVVSRLTVEQQTPLTLSSSSGSASSHAENKVTLIELLADNTLKINGQPYTIQAFLEHAAVPKNQPIAIKLADAVTFQQTITLMEALQTEGFTAVKLSTEGGKS